MNVVMYSKEYLRTGSTGSAAQLGSYFSAWEVNARSSSTLLRNAQDQTFLRRAGSTRNLTCTAHTCSNVRAKRDRRSQPHVACALSLIFFFFFRACMAFYIPSFTSKLL